MKKIKVAVIIKHPYRDGDYRVDVIEVSEDWDFKTVERQLYREMLGPFEILAITEKLNINREFKLPENSDAENHTIE